jgi:hypothetical protein
MRRLVSSTVFAVDDSPCTRGSHRGVCGLHLGCVGHVTGPFNFLAAPNAGGFFRRFGDERGLTG